MTEGPDHLGLSKQAEHQEYAQFAEDFHEFAALSPENPRYERLREKLVREHMPLAEHIAMRFRHRGVQLEDLRQVAMLGLINAVDRFEPDRGNDFLAFAVPTIMGEVRRYFRDAGWAMRVPRRLQELHLNLGKAIDELSQRTGRAPRADELAEYLGIELGEVRRGLEAGSAYRADSLNSPVGGTTESDSQAVSDTIGEQDTNIEDVELRETLQPLLADLPERERRILTLRFFGNLTQSEIARKIGLSQMHVSRLLAQSLKQLRERIYG
ncbi:SigB/SigF/SigG family RNA polymerase sigma factor [Sciscionella marina]|uniref:SigB/SigF/SigG family RNA polymerase sigma factor n=1 Tax=Sciscionella marina TaxID=508770 RepID=UPI00037EE2DC|nr:SigB/SigF/SigG family RNA polymerase sigma factor [Sciscionella marina]